MCVCRSGWCLLVAIAMCLHLLLFILLYFVAQSMCLVVYLRLLSIYISVVCASGLTVDTCLFEFASVYLCVL